MDVTVKLDFLDLSPATGTAASGAYIPYHYIEDENLRLRLYQRMSALGSKQEIALMKREIKDRFGRLPKEMQRLMLIAELRIVAADRGIKSVIVRERTVMLSTEKDYLTVGGRHPRLDSSEATPMLKKIKPAFCIDTEEDTQDFLMGRWPFSHTVPSLKLFLHCWTILHNAKVWPCFPECHWDMVADAELASMESCQHLHVMTFSLLWKVCFGLGQCEALPRQAA